MSERIKQEEVKKADEQWDLLDEAEVLSAGESISKEPRRFVPMEEMERTVGYTVEQASRPFMMDCSGYERECMEGELQPVGVRELSRLLTGEDKIVDIDREPSGSREISSGYTDVHDATNGWLMRLIREGLPATSEELLGQQIRIREYRFTTSVSCREVSQFLVGIGRRPATIHEIVRGVEEGAVKLCPQYSDGLVFLGNPFSWYQEKKIGCQDGQGFRTAELAEGYLTMEGVMHEDYFCDCRFSRMSADMGIPSGYSVLAVSLEGEDGEEVDIARAREELEEAYRSSCYIGGGGRRW